MPDASNADKIQRLELLQKIILDLSNELTDTAIKELLPNKTKTVGLLILCQFRRRERPHHIESLNIQEGKPVFLMDTGKMVFSPAQEKDFPRDLKDQ